MCTGRRDAKAERRRAANLEAAGRWYPGGEHEDHLGRRVRVFVCEQMSHDAIVRLREMRCNQK